MNNTNMICTECNYKTETLGNYKQHCLSKKHIKNIDLKNNIVNLEDKKDEIIEKISSQGKQPVITKNIGLKKNNIVNLEDKKDEIIEKTSSQSRVIKRTIARDYAKH